MTEKSQAGESRLRGRDLENQAGEPVPRPGRGDPHGRRRRRSASRGLTVPLRRKPSLRSSDTRPDGSVCATTQLRSCVEAQQVDRVQMIKLERSTTDQRLGQDEAHRTELPSQILRQAGKEVSEDLAELLDELQDVSRDLPPGGVKDRVIKHKIPTVPGELPNYPKHATTSPTTTARNRRCN